MSAGKQFYIFVPGDQVTDGKKQYLVKHIVSATVLIGVSDDESVPVRLPIDTLRLTGQQPATAAEPKGEDKELLGFSDEEWQEAQRRYQAVRIVLEMPDRSQEAVVQVAQRFGVHFTTLYRWLRAYSDSARVSALVANKPGPAKGNKKLSKDLEVVIQDAIESTYLHKQRHNAQDVIEEVQRKCRLAKIEPPHPNTIRNRIRLVPEKIALQRRGRRDEARSKFSPKPGEFPDATVPLNVVQIDHSPVDLMLVDEVHRKPLCKPYLTIALDVCSRMVVGIHLSLEAPSSTSVALCLAHAINPKREYLAALGVVGTWPVWGKMARIHVDNAAEFHGKAMERGCAEYGIDISWRRKKLPEDGGHVERMIRTAMQRFHKLPGTTFSNIRERKGYDSEAESALTLRDLEQILVEYIVNVYHKKEHSELGMPPERKWELGLMGDGQTPGRGAPPVPQNPERVRLDFLPIYERTVQTYGIEIDCINYFDEVLIPYINATDPDNPRRKRTFLIRRDPRDVSKVFFFDDATKQYFVIPYALRSRPAVSAYELNEVRRNLKREGRRMVDETAIFEALERTRERVAQAVAKTKSARKMAARNPAQQGVDVGKGAVPPRSQPAAPMPQLPYNLAPLPVDDDPFAEPVKPFANVRVSA